jgi:hypothetical protein
MTCEQLMHAIEDAYRLYHNDPYMMVQFTYIRPDGWYVKESGDDVGMWFQSLEDALADIQRWIDRKNL